jgi:hypothetical protein
LNYAHCYNPSSSPLERSEKDSALQSRNSAEAQVGFFKNINHVTVDDLFFPRFDFFLLTDNYLYINHNCDYAFTIVMIPEKQMFVRMAEWLCLRLQPGDA